MSIDSDGSSELLTLKMLGFPLMYSLLHDKNVGKWEQLSCLGRMSETLIRQSAACLVYSLARRRAAPSLSIPDMSIAFRPTVSIAEAVCPGFVGSLSKLERSKGIRHISQSHSNRT